MLYMVSKIFWYYLQIRFWKVGKLMMFPCLPLSHVIFLGFSIFFRLFGSISCHQLLSVYAVCLLTNLHCLISIASICSFYDAFLYLQFEPHVTNTPKVWKFIVYLLPIHQILDSDLCDLTMFRDQSSYRLCRIY